MIHRCCHWVLLWSIHDLFIDNYYSFMTGMSQLFRKLYRLKESLKTSDNGPSRKSGKATDDPAKSQILFPLHGESLKKQLEECCELTRSTCDSLFDLMLLVPSAPWVSNFKEISERYRLVLVKKSGPDFLRTFISFCVFFSCR